MATIRIPTAGARTWPSAQVSTFTLAELQTVVGGYIELVRTCDGDRLTFVNEDGIRLRLELNGEASALAGCRIIGTAILCSPVEAGSGDDDDSEAV